MANETQTQTSEVATAAQVAEMRAMIKKVRDAIARFHTIRRHNNERSAGLRASMVHPAQVQQMLRSTRNSQVEAQAVESLRQFITLLNGREPTQQEMQQGIPEGYEDRLGFVAVPIAVAAVALSLGGSVVSYFYYLTTIEEGNQQRTATPLERLLQTLSDNVWGVAAVGAIALGGAIYIQTSRSTSERRKAEIERYRAAGKALDKSMREVEKAAGSGGIGEKVKGLVKNVLFPPAKNPDLSPAEKLASQYESLSEGERDKFSRILDGDEAEEPGANEADEADEGHEHEEHEEHEHHHHHHEEHHDDEHGDSGEADNEEEGEESESEED